MRKVLTLIAFTSLLVFAPFTASVAQLNGAYTINAGAPATATNYQNFASAVSDMASGTRTDAGPAQGPAVSGPVTFTVAAGTYSEQVTIPAITGASATNTITFDGVDPATRKVTRASSSNGDYTWQMNGADYIRVMNLHVENTGTTNGYGIQLINAANQCEIRKCSVTVAPSGTGNYTVGIIAAPYYTTYSAAAANLKIDSCDVTGGRYNIVANGPSGTQSPGLEITNCDLMNAYYTGIYMYYENSPVIQNNTVDLRQDYNFSYGMQFRYCSELQIRYNQIQHPGAYGIYMWNTNFNTNNPSFVVNNMIGGEYRSTGTSYGLYMSTCRYVNVYHNSIFVDNPSTSARALYMTGSNSTGNDIRNNSFAIEPSNGTNGYAFYVISTNYITTFDYNMLYSNGTNLAYLQGAYTDLASLQLGQPAYNQNSRSGWPNYMSASDLHTFGPPLSNWAQPITGITDDIDGETRPLAPDLIPDVGADEHVMPPFDADINEIQSPLVLGIGNNNVCVEIQNNGSNSLNGVNMTLQYSTDGGTTWPVTQTFIPATLGTPGATESFCFTTPWNVATSGTYNLCVRMNPQIAGDPDPADTICAQVCTGMGGAYTINPAMATGGTNFNNFTDMANALNLCGINAPVTISVSPGAYNEEITIGEVLGASATNTITIDGGNAAQCTLWYSFSSTNEAVLELDGTDYLTFRNMTIDAPGSFGYGVWFKNDANNNTIEDNVITMPLFSTSTYHIGILFAATNYFNYGNTGNDNLIQRNDIRGGYYGMRINGISTTAYCQNNRFYNNSCTEYYYTGIYSRYQQDVEFVGNLCYGRAGGQGSTSGYGIYNYYAIGDFRIEYNTTHTNGTYGMYVGYGNRNNLGHGVVRNNMIGGIYNTNFNGYGMYVLNTYDTDFHNNSINLGGAAGWAVYVTGSGTFSDSLSFVNNIFAAVSPFQGVGGLAFRVNTATAIKEMNYNLYYTGGGQLIYWQGATYTDLASFQAAQPQFNQNSVSDNPGFIAENNLHLICSPIDDLGTYVGQVDDIDGDTRSLTTPDIGADEFTGITITYDLGPDTSHCDRMFLYADTTNYVGWTWGGGQTQPFIPVDTSGYYVVTVTDSNNCRATDSLFAQIDSLPTIPYGNDTLNQCSYDSINAQNAGSSFMWSNGSTNQVTWLNNPGTYNVTITTTAGCQIIDTVTVNFFADAVANLGPDTTFCLGGGTILDAGAGPAGTTYQWNSGASTQVVLVSAPGWYAVTVTSPNGCLASDSVFMNALLQPVVNLGGPTMTACDNWTLDAQNTGATFMWSTGATTQTISGTTGGTYSVTVTNSNGCSTVDQVTITMGTTPTVNLGTDPIICGGQTALLDAGNPGMNYLWSNGATTQTITVGTGGQYIVSVTDPNSGCTGTDDINVIASNLNVNLGPDFTLCDGDQAVLDAGSGPTGYLWSTGSTGQTITVTSGGTYSVQVTDNLGCSTSDDVTVTLAQPPTALYTSPTTVPLFGTINFTDQSSTNVTSWFWDFGDGSTSTQQNPSHNFVAMGTFNVCLTVNDGTCDATFCMDVEVEAPVDIEDELFANNVNVFPNPNNGVFSIDFDLPKFVDVEVDIVAITGQHILHRDISGVRVHREQIDISDKAAGIYFMRVRSNKGNEMIRKIVVE